MWSGVRDRTTGRLIKKRWRGQVRKIERETEEEKERKRGRERGERK